MKNKLYSEGMIDVTAIPGMTVPLNMTAQVDLHTSKTINSISTSDPNGNPTATMTFLKTVIDPTDSTIHQIYTLSLTVLGQNNVTINYGNNEKTVLQFYGLEANAAAIQRHATFMVQNQQVNDPTKYYNKIFDDWMMDTKAKKTDAGAGTNAAGWGDDWGWTHGEFLAEKEVDFPVASEITAVDQYLETAVWGYMMRNHQTDFKVNDWFTQTDAGSWYTRAFPYVHVYNTYFSMYKTEKLHPQAATYLHDRDTYLLRAYGIYKSLWDNLSPSGTGLMGEQTTPELIQALQDEGYTTQANYVISTIRKSITASRLRNTLTGLSTIMTIPVKKLFTWQQSITTILPCWKKSILRQGQPVAHSRPGIIMRALLLLW